MWSSLWSILVCKITSIVGEKLPIRTAHHTFLEVDTLRLLKIYIMFFPPFRDKYPFFRLQLMDLSSEKNQKPSPKCLYCKRYHWSDEYRTVSTLRKQKEKSKGRCYICLHPVHVMIKWKVEKPCFHCKEKGKHRRSLCPTLFPTNYIGQNNAMTVNVKKG